MNKEAFSPNPSPGTNFFSFVNMAEEVRFQQTNPNETPIDIDTGNFSTISIREPKEEDKNKFGADRFDLETSARDAEGNIQDPGSWFLLGYNKTGHRIEIGDYVSYEEVSRAIEELFASTGDGAKIVRHGPTPKEFTDVSSALQDIFAEAIDGHSSFKLTPDSNMPKHNAHGTEVRGADGETFRGSNILLKSEVQLPNGDYVNVEALNVAIQNYFISSGANLINMPSSPRGFRATTESIGRVAAARVADESISQTVAKEEPAVESTTESTTESTEPDFYVVVTHAIKKGAPIIIGGLIAALLAGVVATSSAEGASLPETPENNPPIVNIVPDEELQEKNLEDFMSSLQNDIEETINTNHNQ